MRRLVLVRHAKSAYPAGVGDHDRPLNGRGERDAPEIGRWLAGHVAPGERVLAVVSTAARAQATWAAVAPALTGWAVTRTDEPRIYEAAVPELVGVIEEVDDAVDTLVVVGHNPGLLDLVGYTGQPGAEYAAATSRFPTSAVAVLSTEESWARAVHTHRAFEVEQFAVPRG